MIGRRADDAQSFEEAWSGRAPRDEQIAQLVQFAETLCESAAAQPSPEFRLSLRSSLMTEAQTVLVPVKPSPRTVSAIPAQRPVRRRIAGLTAAALASAGVVGLVSSSASAVPGDILYPVKRSVESIQLAIHQGDASRGSFQLTQASERLAETQELSDNSSPRTEALIATTLDDFSSEAESGGNSLFDEFDANGKKKSVQKVSDFTASAATQLATLSGLLPESAEDSFAAAAKTVGDLALQASALCPTCSSADAQSLVDAVAALAKADAAEGTKSADSTDKSTTTQTPAGTTSPIAPLLPTTEPTITVEPITLAPGTDPLIGSLLGEDGLINGVLGGS